MMVCQIMHKNRFSYHTYYSIQHLYLHGDPSIEHYTFQAATNQIDMSVRNLNLQKYYM